MLHRPSFLPLAMLKLVIRGLDDNTPIPIHIVPRWQWDKYVNCNHRYSILIVTKLIELSFFPSHTSFEEIDKETSDTGQNSSQLKAPHSNTYVTCNTPLQQTAILEKEIQLTSTHSWPRPWSYIANHSYVTVIKSGGIFVLRLGWGPVTEY